MKVKIGRYEKSGFQKSSILIDDFDTWNMDITLASIIHPMLIQLKKTTDVYPVICSEDEWYVILDKMIWSFKEILREDSREGFGDYDSRAIDLEGFSLYNERIQEGLDLFGKFYRSLWD